MALNIKNEEVERLALEVSGITGETKTEAIRKALKERRDRLSYRITLRDREGDLRRFLEREIWPSIPAEVRGRPISREELERILGYGPEGV
jgi:antitoxin VapB